MERGLTQPSIGTFMHLATIIDISPVEWMSQLVTNEFEQK
jgi:transcriptional regulator with XRE-family HTH domain